MGTRNLTVVVSDGQIKVAQYGQWDGYPSGQGATILEFLRNLKSFELFKKRVNKCTFMTAQEIEDFNALASRPEGVAFPPQFSRDVCGKILQMVCDAKDGLKLVNNISFAADSLMCEWAYVVDLDKRSLEVYRGFNNLPLAEDERFAFLTAESLEDHAKTKANVEARGRTYDSPIYYPIFLIHKFRLWQLPSQKRFERILNKKRDETYEQRRIRKAA